MILKEFDNKLLKTYGIETFQSINKLANVNRISFKENSLKKICLEAHNLVKKLFDEDEFFVRITFWNKIEKEKYLSNCILIEDNEDCSIGIFKFKSIDSKFKDLLEEHLNYEQGEEPSVNITAFFFDFNKNVLLNIYDDRGADYIILESSLPHEM